MTEDDNRVWAVVARKDGTQVDVRLEPAESCYFCDDCGDCLSCYFGEYCNPCRWVVYSEDDVAEGDRPLVREILASKHEGDPKMKQMWTAKKASS